MSKCLKKMLTVCLAGWCVIAAAGAVCAASPLESTQNAFARVAEKAMPAVVTICPMKYYGGTYRENGYGSGFLITPDGYIVTNFHVIDGADALCVKLSTGEAALCKVTGTSRNTDLAVLKVNTGRALPYLKFADTSSVKVGHYAIAIGAPFALSQTMTTGIVSQKGRSLGLHYREDYIQTDAAVNPGNSGGPLLNIAGDVIGVNDCILSRSGTSAGIGFAIDGNLARRVVSAIMRANPPVRPYAGIVLHDNHTGTARPVVQAVEPDSPAEKAGFAKGDLIVQAGRRNVSTVRDVQSAILADYMPGDTAEFTVRRDGKTIRIRLTFAAQK